MLLTNTRFLPIPQQRPVRGDGGAAARLLIGGEATQQGAQLVHGVAQMLRQAAHLLQPDYLLPDKRERTRTPRFSWNLVISEKWQEAVYIWAGKKLPPGWRK